MILSLFDLGLDFLVSLLDLNLPIVVLATYKDDPMNSEME